MEKTYRKFRFDPRCGMELTKAGPRVIFNVGGDIFETYENTLARFPETVLGDIHKMSSKLRIISHNRYFVDRNHHSFGAILTFYQTWGKLMCPDDVELIDFVEECKFYEIPFESIEAMKLQAGIYPDSLLNDDPPVEGPSIKLQVWNFMEMPNSSNEAFGYAIVCFLLICISIITVCIETMPQFRYKGGVFATNPWSIAELLLNSWFLVELLVRFTFAPDRSKFLRDTLNWIDAVTVIPYFFTPFFSTKKIKSLGFLKILRFVRIMRLFRISKQSKRLKVVAAIVKDSLPGFQLLLVCLGITVILAGAIMYYIEDACVPKGKINFFTSIPQSIYWAIQALTTVGYGDIHPVSSVGKLISSFYITFGALTICLSVLPIVSKFMLFYKKNLDLPDDDEC